MAGNTVKDMLTTPMPELMKDSIVEAIRIRAKWENDNYICRGHILNGMSDSLFDVYTNVESAKELWDSLESKYMAEDSSSKKFLVSNFNNYKMVYSRPVMKQYNKLLRILGQYAQHGLKMDESIYVSSIIDKLPHSWKDFKHTLKHGKGDLSLVQLGSHLRIEESLRVQDSDKGNGKEVDGPSVNMTEEGGKNTHHKQNKGIAEVVKRTTQMLVVWERGLRTNPKTKIDYGATTHVCKDCCWFKTYEPVEDGSVLYMGDNHFAPVHGKESVALEFSSGKTITLYNVLYVPKLRNNLVSGPMLNKCGYKHTYMNPINSVYMSSFTVVNSSLWHARLGHVHYKRMLEMSKDELIPAVYENSDKCTTCNKKYVITFIDDASRFCYVYLLHEKDEALDKFRIYKTKVELQQNNLIKTLRKDRGGEYYDLVFFQSVGIIHETTAPYTPQQNGVTERKNRALKEMVNSMLYPKRKTLGEKGIDCIFVGYAEHSKAYRPKDIIPNSDESQRDDLSDDVPNEIPEPRKEEIDDEIGSIMENNTWVQSDLAPGCKPLGCKWIFKRKMKVDGTVDKFKARLVIQGFRQKEGIDYFDTYASVARITIIRLLLALAAIHNLVIHQIDVKTTFLNGDLEEEVYMKQPERFVMPVDKTKKFLSSRFSMKDMREADVILGIKIKRENKRIVITQSHYIEKILKKFNREDYSPASKKQTCITDSTMEYEFVALAAAGKEAEWLRNLIHEIPIWPKPIAPISIRCDSAPTMARAYSQIYNGKTRHLGVRHSMVRELIRNGVISIEFVRTRHNLANHLTKGLARDLVYKLVIGMGLKSIRIYYL
nr:hypothetical protein [Tanacetum cinerariifolium]